MSKTPYDGITHESLKKFGKKDSPGYVFLLELEKLENDIEVKRKSGMYKNEYLAQAKQKRLKELESAHRKNIEAKKAEAEKELLDLQKKYQDTEDPLKAFLNFERKKLKTRAKSLEQLVKENQEYSMGSGKRDIDELLLLSSELRNRGKEPEADDITRNMEIKRNTEPWHLDETADELVEKMERVGTPLGPGRIRFTVEGKDGEGVLGNHDEDWEIGTVVRDE